MKTFTLDELVKLRAAVASRKREYKSCYYQKDSFIKELDSLYNKIDEMIEAKMPRGESK